MDPTEGNLQAEKGLTPKNLLAETDPTAGNLQADAYLAGGVTLGTGHEEEEGHTVDPGQQAGEDHVAGDRDRSATGDGHILGQGRDREVSINEIFHLILTATVFMSQIWTSMRGSETWNEFS